MNCIKHINHWMLILLVKFNRTLFMNMHSATWNKVVNTVLNNTQVLGALIKVTSRM